MIAYITELNVQNYKSFTEKGLVLIDIKAEWCQPCKLIGPIVDQISNEYQGKLSVGKLDVDGTVNVDGDEKENRDIVTTLGVRNIPTLILYKDGVVVDKLVGSVTKEKIKELVENNLN